MIDYRRLRKYLYTIKKHKLYRGIVASIIGISDDTLGKFEIGESRINLFDLFFIKLLVCQ